MLKAILRLFLYLLVEFCFVGVLIIAIYLLLGGLLLNGLNCEAWVLCVQVVIVCLWLNSGGFAWLMVRRACYV